MQGMGWLCLEELQWGDAQHPWVRPGHLFTKVRVRVCVCAAACIGGPPAGRRHHVRA